MEDPQHLPDNDPSSPDKHGEELQRRAEEAMEQMLLEQQDEDDRERGNQNEVDDFGDLQDPNSFEDDVHDDESAIDDGNDEANNNDDEEEEDWFFEHETALEKKSPFTYVRVSLWAALLLVYYAYRSRQQWYLALVFLSSSKYAYIILGNAFVASLIWVFRVTTDLFLNGLRLTEAEGLTDFFRWHITETCLALTIFRSELSVKTLIMFFVLILAKCLHYIVDAREAHLRMTEEVVVPNPNNPKWISLKLPQVKLFVLICIFQVLDIGALVLCAQDILKYGESPTILFGFESAIMLTSVISNSMNWNIHLLDGIFHFLHESSEPGTLFHRWIHPWKDHKATLGFAVDLQAQIAKFLFYLVFFATVMTNYGLPLNLIREVYVSFQALKGRFAAFLKYRKLMASMNRFQSPTEEELEEERICIICRDEMSVETSKRLPGCGHIMHKSCLREWLVQQQTCPTCRSDIHAMEARQQMQDRLERVNENNEAQEEGESESDDNSDESQSQGSDEDESSSGNPSVGSLSTEPKNDVNVATQDEASPQTKTVATQSVFPAFYRVTQSDGASVYRYPSDKDDNDPEATVRIVPSGMIVLGIEMKYRKSFSGSRMMIQIPDGWVADDELERIVAVSLKT